MIGNGGLGGPGIGINGGLIPGSIGAIIITGGGNGPPLDCLILDTALVSASEPYKTLHKTTNINLQTIEKWYTRIGNRASHMFITVSIIINKYLIDIK